LWPRRVRRTREARRVAREVERMAWRRGVAGCSGSGAGWCGEARRTTYAMGFEGGEELGR
jgi:hypothetical protein